MTAILENLQDHAHGLPVKELEAAITEFTQMAILYEIFKRGEQDAEFISRAAEFGLGRMRQYLL